MRPKLSIAVIVLLCILFFLAAQGICQDSTDAAPASASKKPALKHAVMCEEIKDFIPYNPGAVFSIAIGKVSCFTFFDPVPEKTVIYHKWYHQDKPSTNKRLTLQPPRWSAYTSILLRETDKGPWRVEILDQAGKLIDVLRFSITD